MYKVLRMSRAFTCIFEVAEKKESGKVRSVKEETFEEGRTFVSI